MADIVISSVRKTFDRSRVTAVDSVDLTVADGELFVLLGPSGCGKTTLLRMIAGLEAADSGTIMIGDRDVTMLPPRKRDLAMVFQNYAVFPHLTVEQNIAFGLRMKRGTGPASADPASKDKAALTEKVRQAAELVDLGDLLGRRPAQLSGGQQQRVAVARALAVSPSVLLMDEPLSNLDALLRLKFRADLKRIVHELRTTVIYVTHDQVEALSLADRMAVMKDGQIVQAGPPLEVYDHPANTFVGGFLGSPPMNFLPVAIDAAEFPATRSSDAGSPDDGPRAMVGPRGDSFPAPEAMRGWGGRELLAGIRGENMDVLSEPAPGAVAGKVLVVEPLGAQTLVTVASEDTEVKVLTPPGYTARSGADVWLRPAPDKVRWYDPDYGTEVTIP